MQANRQQDWVASKDFDNRVEISIGIQLGFFVFRIKLAIKLLTHRASPANQINTVVHPLSIRL